MSRLFSNEAQTTAEKSVAAAAVINPPMPVSRIASVDVYRGFVMLLMMGEILSFDAVSKQLPGSSFWGFLAYNQSHVEWTWLALHDMIQPSFTFLVGVVLPYSIASRKSKGASFNKVIFHTIKRSLILIFLGIFLRSMSDTQTYFTFEDTLTQIGLGYTFLVLLSYCSQRIQIAALVIILVGYWLAFALYPLPGTDFNYASAGVVSNWEYNLHGFAAHWNKNTNLAWAFDKWFLNLFPRESPFLNNGGGYATLSFIPTLGTMILGLFAGKVLKENSAQKDKLKFFITMGVALILTGVVLHFTGINPIVKRIWTPAWTIFSGGICCLFLAFFYGIVDVANKRKWSFFLMVIGANSIAAYCIADGGIRSFIAGSLYIHLGPTYDQIFGAPYATLVKGMIVLFFIWLILYWMYKKKIFIKI
ncbi:acyltransferase family protein [Ferruginibacter sp.]|uniref:acyltransferase family protein n=2 Tax=Ferruginibacter sp. TaxID=1940288 RepID=UPI00374D1469